MSSTLRRAAACHRGRAFSVQLCGSSAAGAPSKTTPAALLIGSSAHAAGSTGHGWVAGAAPHAMGAADRRTPFGVASRGFAAAAADGDGDAANGDDRHGDDETNAGSTTGVKTGGDEEGGAGTRRQGDGEGADEGDGASVEEEVDPEGADVPTEMITPSWLRKRVNRAEKGSYEGMQTEIDSYDTLKLGRDGDLYNLREFSKITEDFTDDDIKAWCEQYLEHERQMYIAHGGGDPNISMEEFNRVMEKEFEVPPEEKKKHILNWEVHTVMEAVGPSDHPLNRKVTLRVKLKDLQRETGLSDEALEYIKDICGKRYVEEKVRGGHNSRKSTRKLIKIVCTRSRNREHNRQWCLKVLYDLIEEGNKEFPSPNYRFTPEGPKEPGTF